ncbi:MAG: hypothetical protein OEL83_15835 [Desulforhopalus sp.]|nr:hypothetical protein [Desulforhopalus sp.]
MKVRVFFLQCCLAVLLSACSLPYVVPGPDPAGPGKDEKSGRLLNIRVQRWDTERFSGLLGLRQREADLYYVLLDATGVKLLEAEVALDGSHQLLRVTGPMKNTEFAPFLSEALARIYLQEPSLLPCGGGWWQSLCREAVGTGGGFRKYAQIGPLPFWQVTMNGEEATGREAPIVYRQPWLGVAVFLEPAKQVQ